MQNSSYYRQRHLMIIPIIITLFLSLSCDPSNQVTIYRDNWGIPHIYADTEENLAYAFGYAQAEDRLIQILTSYRHAEGTMAEAFGKRFVDSDYNQRVWQHATIAQKNFPRLSADMQNIFNHFVAGIKQYMKEHPDKVPDWAPEIHPWHILALGRAFIWGWPLGQARGDFWRGKRKIERPHHSNQWLVSAERSAEGVPIALIDPHLNFETSGHWMEARLHAGEMQAAGMCIPGTPFIGLGHNQYISWAATTGGPDCADVYELDINPDNPLQYQYDGQWREITKETVLIRVKEENDIKEIERIVERSHYGPVMERDGNKAYAFKLAYADEFLLVDQMLNINKAKNLTDFKSALAMCQMMPQNMMYAGIDGNIYYARTGRVPIRPESYDWDYPLPGNTKATEWLGIHPHQDLIQITNPATGFMQNCNISPGTMMPNSPFTKDKYPAYIYNDTENRSNPRGRSAVRLLEAEKKLTVERAKQIALNTTADGFEIWQSALKESYKTNTKFYPDLQNAVTLITGWNGHLDADNTAAALYRFWRRECNKVKVNLPTDEDGTIKDLSTNDQKNMLKALKKAKQYLTDKFGSFQIPWGTTVRLKRGEKTWPVSGGSFNNGVNVLRAASGRLSDETGITTVMSGQSCCMLVVLSDPIRSYSILPWGESDDPDSPHYTDQAEALFSKSEFKSTYFLKEELMKHVESEKNILVPEDIE